MEQDNKLQDEEAIKASFEWKPKEISEEKADTYSYHFWCWGCLLPQQGTMKSDDKLLEIECPNPDCGKVNHCYGRRLKSKK